MSDFVDCFQQTLALGVSHEACDNQKNTPFHYAALFDSVEVSKLLWIKGANLDAINSKKVLFVSNETPLHCACYGMAPNTLAFLLSVGVNIEAKDVNGHTPVFIAVQRGFIEGVTLLIRECCELNGKDKMGVCSLFINLYST